MAEKVLVTGACGSIGPFVVRELQANGYDVVATDLARMTYMVREADRMVAYIDEIALPNLRQSSDTIAAAYGTGMTNFAMIPETRQMVLAMQVERVAALREREKTLADLSLLVAGEAPAGAPLPDKP